MSCPHQKTGQYVSSMPGMSVPRTLKGHKRRVNCVAVHRSGKLALSVERRVAVMKLLTFGIYVVSSEMVPARFTEESETED